MSSALSCNKKQHKMTAQQELLLRWIAAKTIAQDPGVAICRFTAAEALRDTWKGRGDYTTVHNSLQALTLCTVELGSRKRMAVYPCMESFIFENTTGKVVSFMSPEVARHFAGGGREDENDGPVL